MHPHVLLHHPNEQTETASIQQKLRPCLTWTYKRNSSIPEANSGSEIEREEKIDQENKVDRNAIKEQIIQLRWYVNSRQRKYELNQRHRIK